MALGITGSKGALETLREEKAGQEEVDQQAESLESLSETVAELQEERAEMLETISLLEEKCTAYEEAFSSIFDRLDAIEAHIEYPWYVAPGTHPRPEWPAKTI